jgi:hypothetical protein
MRFIAEPDLSRTRIITVAERNQIISARMYIADLEYHKYEAKLTRDLQTEGLASTLAVLGLTSSAALITVASTKSILAETAAVVTGADKAFSEKVLLSNTIQALQVQMRIDRQTQAAAILAKMPVSIEEYTLPMALSDVDKYYQAGTLASALVGLNKTVATAEQHATTAHDLAGPNGELVTRLKAVANPPPLASTQQILGSATVVLPSAPHAPPAPPGDRRTPTELRMTPNEITGIQQALCVSPSNGLLGPLTRTAIHDYLLGRGVRNPPTAVDTVAIRSNLGAAADAIPDCRVAGYLNAYEVGAFGMPIALSAAKIMELQNQLAEQLKGQTLTVDGQPATLVANGKMDAVTRTAIARVRELKKIAPTLGGQMDPKLGAALIQ